MPRQPSVRHPEAASILHNMPFEAGILNGAVAADSAIKYLESNVRKKKESGISRP